MFYTWFWFSNNRCFQAIEVVINKAIWWAVGRWQEPKIVQLKPIIKQTYFGMTQGVKSISYM